MTVPPNQPDTDATDATDAIDTDALLTQLRRKQGSWVEWGRACRDLQRTGMSPQSIFEATGFEPIQQNQIIVAAQVYESLATADEAVQQHFAQRGSDQLYELRVLSQQDRPRVAAFCLRHGLDADEVRELVKPIKEYSYRQAPPPHFSDDPGDAVAFYFWGLARQKSDLQARSRLIAQGLRFAHSSEARQQIEKLLTDFSVVKSRPAPRLPLYRLESETELPRILPVAGKMPLAVEAFKAVPVTVGEDPFGIVQFSGTGAWVAVPGWQVVMQAEDPVGLLMPLADLPTAPADMKELVLVICDRNQRQWQPDSYFLAADNEALDIRWFEDEPELPLLGRVILIMRPKKILDEGYTKELWQVDE